MDSIQRVPRPLTISQVLEGFIEEARNTIEKSSGGDVLHEARAVEGAIIHVIQIQQAAGQIVLSGMWKIYSEKLYIPLGWDSFMDWAVDALGSYDANAYYRELALMTYRILARIDAAENTDSAFLLPDGNKITVTKLLDTPGIMGKLKMASSAFDNAERSGNELSHKLLQTVMTGTRESVKGIVREITGGEITVIRGIQEINADGSTDIYLPRLSVPEYGLLMALMGETLVLSSDAVSDARQRVRGGITQDWVQVASAMVKVLGAKEEMQWTLEDARIAKMLPSSMWAHVAKMKAADITPQQRYAVYGALFGRPFESSATLTRAEAETLNRLSKLSDFMRYVEEYDE